MRYASRSVYALLCVLAAVACPRAAYSQPAASPGQNILGTYYFKGMALLEIRQEGQQIVTELQSEKEGGLWGKPEIYKDPKEKAFYTQLNNYRHRGRLATPTSLEFEESDASFANILKRFGLSEDMVPENELRGLKEAIPAKVFGRYHERWELLPDGQLKIACAVPIINPAFAFEETETKPIKEFLQGLQKEVLTSAASDFLGEYKKSRAAGLQLVCGWKITNEAELNAWKALDGGNFTQAIQQFQSAEQAQSTRPFPYFGEAWARLGTKEFDLARKTLQAGTERLTSETRPWLEGFVVFLKDQIDAYEIAAKGADVDYPAFVEAVDAQKLNLVDPSIISELSKKPVREWTKKDFQAANKAVTAFPLWAQLQKTAQMKGHGPLLPIGQSAFFLQTLAKTKTPNYLNHQQIAKLTVISGHLYRALKKNDTAIYQYCMAVHRGQMMRHGAQLSHLIGIAMEKIGLSGLSQFVEDGLIADPQTLLYMTQMIEALVRNEPPSDSAATMLYDGQRFPFASDPVLDLLMRAINGQGSEGVVTRMRLNKANLALLRAAYTVKAKALKPPFPQAMDAAALPKDPFAPEQPLHYRAAGNEALLYSVGPDKKDENVAAIYDPTNGTLSVGDVVLKVR